MSDDGETRPVGESFHAEEWLATERVSKDGFDKNLVGLEKARRRARNLLSEQDGNASNVPILVGPPGSGKTALARAVATDLARLCGTCAQYGCSTHDSEEYDEVMRCFVRTRRLFHSHFHEPDGGVATAIEYAKECIGEEGAAVLLFDEFEPLVSEPLMNGDGDHVMVDSVAKELRRLQLTDDNLFAICDVNHPEATDPEVDAVTELVAVLPPSSPSELDDLWRSMVAGQKNSDDINCRRLGKASVGFTPRELEQLRRRAIRDIYADEKFDPADMPLPTTEDYIELLDTAEPTSLPRYIRNLDRSEVKTAGVPPLVEWYDEWQERFNLKGETVHD